MARNFKFERKFLRYIPGTNIQIHKDDYREVFNFHSGSDYHGVVLEGDILQISKYKDPDVYEIPLKICQLMAFKPIKGISYENILDHPEYKALKIKNSPNKIIDRAVQSYYWGYPAYMEDKVPPPEYHSITGDDISDIRNHEEEKMNLKWYKIPHFTYSSISADGKFILTPNDGGEHVIMDLEDVDEIVMDSQIRPTKDGLGYIDYIKMKITPSRILQLVSMQYPKEPFYWNDF